MSDTFCFLHLRGDGNNTRQLEQVLIDAQAEWQEQGIEVWGVWRGLFGVASNELILMTSAAGARPQDDFHSGLSAAQVLRCSMFQPTLRPSSRDPLERPGVYVFRFFSVLPADVPEFLDLSGAAWTSFEGADDFAAQPQGLFSELGTASVDGTLDMLLVTWYDSLQSWQTSRAPAPAARDRFARRHKLTRRTVALATMLLPEPVVPKD